jgi:hypothetical protein
MAVAAPVVIEAVIPAGHEIEAVAKTPVVIETSLATEAVPPGKMRTCKPTANFGATEMAAPEAATEMAAPEAAAEMAATKTATVTTAATKTATVTSAATKTAPVTSATAPMGKRVDSQSAGESGSRSQDDHGLA